MKTVVFVGAHDLMVPYINDLTRTHKVYVYDSGIFTVPLSSEVVVRKLTKKLFGVQKFFTGERSMPWYMALIQTSLKTDKPDDIIVLDFIRLWYLQAVWYRLKNSSVRLHLYSESQRAPKSLLSAGAFVFFWIFLLCSQKLLTTYFAFTGHGVKFAQKMSINVPLILLPAPVDVQLFAPCENKIYYKCKMLRLLINARYVDYKRHIDIFKAVKALNIQGHNIHISCIGRESSKGRAKIENLVRIHNLSKEVVFLEAVSRSQMVTVYKDYDLLVLASDNEAIGMVVPEAMACGLATITSDSVGANLYIINGQTGLTFITKKVPDLVRAIKYFDNEEIIKQFGTAARSHISDNFTICDLNLILRKQLHE